MRYDDDDDDDEWACDVTDDDGGDASSNEIRVLSCHRLNFRSFRHVFQSTGCPNGK